MNYYNEHDPKAAAWLRELIKAGHIAHGVVDERSITDILSGELEGYTQCHFFAGIGGWSLALRLAGWPDDRPVWTGSCPCQPFSSAGKGLGEKDERHLWPVFAELIRACEPPVAFGEQVASKAGREWLAGVFADLEGMGYQRAAADLCAAGVGSPQIRQRLYWVANTAGPRLERPSGTQLQGSCAGFTLDCQDGHWGSFDSVSFRDGSRRRVEAGTFPLDHGVRHRVGMLRGYGNAIVPQVAAEFIQAFESAVNDQEA